MEKDKILQYLEEVLDSETRKEILLEEIKILKTNITKAENILNTYKEMGISLKNEYGSSYYQYLIIHNPDIRELYHKIINGTKKYYTDHVEGWKLWGNQLSCDEAHRSVLLLGIQSMIFNEYLLHQYREENFMYFVKLLTSKISENKGALRPFTAYKPINAKFYYHTSDLIQKDSSFDKKFYFSLTPYWVGYMPKWGFFSKLDQLDGAEIAKRFLNENEKIIDEFAKLISLKMEEYYKVNVAPVYEYIETSANELLETSKKILADVENQLEEEEVVLQQLYEQNIISLKYRHKYAVAAFIDYINTGRCSEFIGFNGAYNLFENEVRMNLIIQNLEEIRKDLQTIKNNQYAIYCSVTIMNQKLDKINCNLAGLEKEMGNVIDKIEHGFNVLSTDLNSSFNNINMKQDITNQLLELANERANTVAKNQEFTNWILQNPSSMGLNSTQQKHSKFY